MEIIGCTVKTIRSCPSALCTDGRSLGTLKLYRGDRDRERFGQCHNGPPQSFLSGNHLNARGTDVYICMYNIYRIAYTIYETCTHNFTVRVYCPSFFVFFADS